MQASSYIVPYANQLTMITNPGLGQDLLARIQELSVDGDVVSVGT